MRLRSDRLALELKRARVPALWVAFLFVSGGIATWALYHNLHVQWPWQDTRKVQVRFENVKGVLPGQHEVRIAGVKVGLVTDAKVSGKSAVLTLSIDEKYGPVYRDARMRLRPVTPLQDLYVAIESRGSRRAGELRGGDVLAIQRTETPVDISRVLNTFDADTRSRLASLLNDVGAGMGAHGEQLRRAFVELAPFLRAADRLAGALAERRGELARIVSNLGGLTAAVNTRDRQLTGLINAGNGTLHELARRDGSLSATLAELPPALRQMRSSFATLRSAQDELDPALRALDPVAEHLEPGLAALERVSGDAMPALRSLEPAVKRLRPLAADLAPTSAALRDSLTQLAPSAPRLDEVTRKIVPCRTAVEKFFHWTLSVMKFYDSGGAWPRGELVLGAPSATLGTAKDPSIRQTWTCTQGGPPK